MSNRRRQFCDRRSLPGPREARLRATELFLGALSIVDSSEQGIPADHAALRVPHRGSPRVKPTIDAIATTKAVLDVIRVPRFYRRFPESEDARTIIRVDKVVPLIGRQWLYAKECQ